MPTGSPQVPLPPLPSTATAAAAAIAFVMPSSPASSHSGSTPPLPHVLSHPLPHHAGGASEIKYEDLAQYFTLPEKAVAKELGICLTSLKKICRNFGITRWPFRKVKSLEKRYLSPGGSPRLAGDLTGIAGLPPFSLSGLAESAIMNSINAKAKSDSTPVVTIVTTTTANTTNTTNTTNANASKTDDEDEEAAAEGDELNNSSMNGIDNSLNQSASSINNNNSMNDETITTTTTAEQEPNDHATDSLSTTAATALITTPIDPPPYPDLRYPIPKHIRTVTAPEIKRGDFVAFVNGNVLNLLNWSQYWTEQHIRDHIVSSFGAFQLRLKDNNARLELETDSRTTALWIRRILMSYAEAHKEALTSPGFTSPEQMAEQDYPIKKRKKWMY